MKFKKFWPIAVLFILIIVFWLSGFKNYLTIDYLLEAKDDLQVYIDRNLILSLILFGIIYVVIVALSLPFASFMTMAAGLLFGFIPGTVTVVMAATCGATIIFLIAKSSFGKMLRDKAGKLYNKIESDMRDNAASYLLFLRLVPLFPFFMANIVPAFFNIKTRTYIWTTALGICPGTAIYVNVGRSLGEVENPADLVSKDLVFSIALLGVAALTPTIYKKWKGRSNVES
jgi:uncharacterized membrane protein YdjX (TVP38/TMEM64 family)